MYTAWQFKKSVQGLHAATALTRLSSQNGYSSGEMAYCLRECVSRLKANLRRYRKLL